MPQEFIATNQPGQDNRPRAIPICFATQNGNKRQELLAFLETSATSLSNSSNHHTISIELTLPERHIEVEENGSTFEENACLKALAYQKALPDYAGWILAEDSGLVVEALSHLAQAGFGEKFPGVISKRWLNKQRQQELFGQVLKQITQNDLNRGILKLMANQPNRQASYHCCMALINAETDEIYSFQGMMPLQVAEQARGEYGFGYDPIMLAVVDNTAQDITVAELSAADKNALSHRAKAFLAVLNFLANL